MHECRERMDARERPHQAEPIGANGAQAHPTRCLFSLPRLCQSRPQRRQQLDQFLNRLLLAGELAQRRHLMQHLAPIGRRKTHHLILRCDFLGDPGLRVHNRPVTDLDVIRHAALRGQRDVVADHGGAADADLAAQK